MRPPLKHALLLLALVVLPSLLALRSRGFFSPDETYYAEVAREMTTARDPVVPTFDGKPFLEKPPLVYWLLAAGFAVGGWGFASAVALNSLLTAATALLLYSHVRRDASPRAALLAGIAYATMLLPTATSRTALTDPVLTVCTTASIILFLRGGGRAAVLAGTALGLGVLAKGPVAPLVVLPAVAAALALRRDGRSIRNAGVALGAAVVVAAPWHLALAARGLLDDYAAVFLGGQVLSRAIDPWRQQGPWWYYLPVLWAASFPWGTHLILAVRDCWLDLRRGGTRAVAVAAEVGAVVVPLLAFTLAQNKFPHYLLPMLPWLAAWLGRAGDRLLEPGDHRSLARRVAPLVGLLSAASVLSVALLVSGSRLVNLAPAGVVPVLAATALLFFAAGLLETARPRTAWAALAGLSLLLHAGADALVVPRFAAALIEQPLAVAVRRHVEPAAAPVAHRWFRPSFVTYGVSGWTMTQDRAGLDATLERLRASHRDPVVVVRSDAEGEVRAAAWRRGGEARELTRVRGLGEINGEILEAIVFATAHRRDGRRWFSDADGDEDGEGFSSVEGNPWVASFRWSVAREAVLRAAADPASDAVLRLRAWGASTGARWQRLDVAINGRDLGTVTLGEQPSLHALSVPRSALRPGGPQSLTLRVEFLAAPAERDPASDDRRTLGFALDWIVLEPGGETLDLVAD